MSLPSCWVRGHGYVDDHSEVGHTNVVQHNHEGGGYCNFVSMLIMVKMETMMTLGTTVRLGIIVRYDISIVLNIVVR